MNKALILCLCVLCVSSLVMVPSSDADDTPTVTVECDDLLINRATFATVTVMAGDTPVANTDVNLTIDNAHVTLADSAVTTASDGTATVLVTASSAGISVITATATIATVDYSGTDSVTVTQTPTDALRNWSVGTNGTYAFLYDEYISFNVATSVIGDQIGVLMSYPEGADTVYFGGVNIPFVMPKSGVVTFGDFFGDATAGTTVITLDLYAWVGTNGSWSLFDTITMTYNPTTYPSLELGVVASEPYHIDADDNDVVSFPSIEFLEELRLTSAYYPAFVNEYATLSGWAVDLGTTSHNLVHLVDVGTYNIEDLIIKAHQAGDIIAQQATISLIAEYSSAPFGFNVTAAVYEASATSSDPAVATAAGTTSVPNGGYAFVYVTNVAIDANYAFTLTVVDSADATTPVTAVSTLIANGIFFVTGIEQDLTVTVTAIEAYTDNSNVIFSFNRIDGKDVELTFNTLNTDYTPIHTENAEVTAQTDANNYTTVTTVTDVTYNLRMFGTYYRTIGNLDVYGSIDSLPNATYGAYINGVAIPESTTTAPTALSDGTLTLNEQRAYVLTLDATGTGTDTYNIYCAQAYITQVTDIEVTAIVTSAGTAGSPTITTESETETVLTTNLTLFDTTI